LLLREAEEAGAAGASSMLIHMPDKVLQLRVIQLKDGGGVSGYCLMLYDITNLSAGPGEVKPDAAISAPPLFKLPISLKGRVVLLDICEVAFLRAEGHYTQVHTATGQFFCNLSLSQLETRLPDSFMRVHRSYIVNVARASGIRHRDDQFVICVEGRPEEQDIPVSRNNIARLRHLLGV
jgi:DNA-binding LytR/AlgR family response regulator